MVSCLWDQLLVPKGLPEEMYGMAQVAGVGRARDAWFEVSARVLILHHTRSLIGIALVAK